MKDKIIYFIICLLTYLVIYLIEFMGLSLIFAILRWNGFFVPFIYVILLICVNPFLTWTVANDFYNKIQNGSSSDK